MSLSDFRISFKIYGQCDICILRISNKTQKVFSISRYLFTYLWKTYYGTYRYGMVATNLSTISTQQFFHTYIPTRVYCHIEIRSVAILIISYHFPQGIELNVDRDRYILGTVVVPASIRFAPTKKNNHRISGQQQVYKEITISYSMPTLAIGII